MKTLREIALVAAMSLPLSVGYGQGNPDQPPDLPYEKPVIELDGGYTGHFDTIPEHIYQGDLTNGDIGRVKGDLMSGMAPMTVFDPSKDYIDGTIDWNPGVEFRGVQIITNEGIGVIDDRHLEDCIIIGYPNSDGDLPYGPVLSDSTTTYMYNNIIAGFQDGIIYSQPTNGGVNLRNNMIVGCDRALVSTGYLNMGDASMHGANIMRGNRRNMAIYDSGDGNGNPSGSFIIDSEENYWYDQEGNLLTTESEIAESMDLIVDGVIWNPDEGTRKSRSDLGLMVDVVPFRTYEPTFEQPASVSGWVLY